MINTIALFNFNVIGVEGVYGAENGQHLEFLVLIGPYGVKPPGILMKYGMMSLRAGGNSRFAPNSQISPFYLYKCGFKSPQIEKIWNFWYKFAHKGKFWGA